MAAALSSRARPPAADPRRYWAPCLGVALVAMALFHATLKDLVNESAARAALVTTAVVPAEAEPDRSAAGQALPDGAPSAPSVPVTLTNTNFEPSVILPAAPTAKAAPAVVEVHKCVMPEGNAAYSDGPCPAGAHATTLRLPRDLHASASL
ncbi:hypothetical protein [Variovorax sp. EBFNA2]|uniref:hypothetical protein n=1 Tax=Variovorax sp. EBFNA2 TaxID=3342097 RepID=UPI0029C0F558|nr:hypothetical protein [Variovorax boronicumulans]WPG39977.1 hypothetical protein RZE79_11740 [Variovorax boronicumulans]